MVKRFQKNAEDFICERCGRSMVGGGFTNHCSECLWSKHVDKNPGDRLEKCLGLMRPIAVEGGIGTMTITHWCEKCGYVKKNKVAPDDNFSAVLAVAKERAEN